MVEHAASARNLQRANSNSSLRQPPDEVACKYSLPGLARSRRDQYDRRRYLAALGLHRELADVYRLSPGIQNEPVTQKINRRFSGMDGIRRRLSFQTTDNSTFARNPVDCGILLDRQSAGRNRRAHMR